MLAWQENEKKLAKLWKLISFGPSLSSKFSISFQSAKSDALPEHTPLLLLLTADICEHLHRYNVFGLDEDPDDDFWIVV